MQIFNAASLSSIKPLSLNRVDTVQNEYTKLLGQFPELTRPTTKGETVKDRRPLGDTMTSMQET